MTERKKEKKKKDDEENIMVEEEKKMATRLKERSFHVHNLTNNELDMMDQLLLVNWEMNKKDKEIINMRSHGDQLRNELRYDK